MTGERAELLTSRSLPSRLLQSLIAAWRSGNHSERSSGRDWGAGRMATSWSLLRAAGSGEPEPCCDQGTTANPGEWQRGGTGEPDGTVPPPALRLQSQLGAGEPRQAQVSGGGDRQAAEDGLETLTVHDLVCAGLLVKCKKVTHPVRPGLGEMASSAALPLRAGRDTLLRPRPQRLHR